MDRIDDAGIGQLLEDIAGGLGDGCQEEDVCWIGIFDRTRDLDGDLERAWGLVRQAQESARMNPRRSARSIRDPQEWHELLRRMEQAVAETRSLVRTLGGQSAAPGRPGASRSRGRGSACSRTPVGASRDAGTRTAVREVYRRTGCAHRRAACESESFAGVAVATAPHHQPGGNNRNDAMARVAEANPLGVGRVPIRLPARRAPRS